MDNKGKKDRKVPIKAKAISKAPILLNKMDAFDSLTRRQRAPNTAEDVINAAVDAYP